MQFIFQKEISPKIIPLMKIKEINGVEMKLTSWQVNMTKWNRKYSCDKNQDMQEKSEGH